ncbi:hypothetical protein [Alloprevotella tannerae]|uniref:hypothetical protein n=1 Tax=Alloprevotella tannerae TaxID=76122 RepID=UPI00288943E1|nr:hypothetical protein [Alloprevotella tannerae]
MILTVVWCDHTIVWWEQTIVWRGQIIVWQEQTMRKWSNGGLSPTSSVWKSVD